MSSGTVVSLQRAQRLSSQTADVDDDITCGHAQLAALAGQTGSGLEVNAGPVEAGLAMAPSKAIDRFRRSYG